ncbi:MAG TPA: GNAT family N-acetyltransferase [Patescibacteria group bacterium]
MQLVFPSIQYKDSYLQAVNEADVERNPFITTIARPRKDQPFEDFVKSQIDKSNGLNLPEGWVPATELWLIDNNEVIGTVNIRHFLTDPLLRTGGHIGYYIRPSKRMHGYGKAILALGLEQAKRLGLDKVLLTCDETNVGSSKIIEENGGVLENIVDTEPNHPRKKRYWITIH